MEPEPQNTVRLTLRDGWMISQTLDARRDIIDLYFETISLMLQDVDRRQNWGVEIDLRGNDFTNEAFLELYRATVRAHSDNGYVERADLLEMLERLSKSPKLSQSLYQSRAVLLRMLLFFSSPEHPNPLTNAVIEEIGDYLIMTTLAIVRLSARGRQNVSVNRKYSERSGLFPVFLDIAYAAEARFIEENFYGIEASVMKRILSRYLKNRFNRLQFLSQGAYSNHLALSFFAGPGVHVFFNNLRANRQWDTVNVPAKGEYSQRTRCYTTALGSVLIGHTGNIYTMPLAGNEWIYWEKSAELLFMCCGPEYVVTAPVTADKGSGKTEKMKAYRFNLLGRIGDVGGGGSSTTNHDPDKEFRQKLETFASRQLVVALACGAHHVLALTQRGTMAGCGSNQSGQLGCGHYGGFSSGWFKLEDAPIASRVVAGYGHTLVLDNQSKLWGCGNNESGELGLGSAVARVRVLTRLVPGGDPDDLCAGVWCGARHSVVWMERGGLMVCGANESGQLGLGDLVNRREWVISTKQPHSIIDVSCGAFFTAILTPVSLWISGGSSQEWTHLALPDIVNSFGRGRTHIPLPEKEKKKEEEETIDLTMPTAVDPYSSVCRFCRKTLRESSEEAIQEKLRPSLIYCNKECQRGLHAAIRVIQSSK